MKMEEDEVDEVKIPLSAGLWPIFKNRRDIDCVPDAEVSARVGPLLEAIERAGRDWQNAIENAHGEEAAEEYAALMGSCLFCIETLVAKLQRLAQQQTS
jgi:hypothetical protein